MSKAPIWYVAHPLSLYVEDAKALAREHGLRIVDAAFDAGDGADNVPDLTLRDEAAAPAQDEAKAPSESPAAKRTKRAAAPAQD